MSELLSTLKAGDLAASLQLLQQAVRQAPGDARQRVFLFQLLAVLGQWDRALAQLDVLATLDAGALQMVHAYRATIRCERWREDAFAGLRAPLLFGTPAPWMAQFMSALRLDAAGDTAGAAQLREAALADAPALTGSIDGNPFDWLMDADPRLGPMLEWISNGNYYWLPMQHIAQLECAAPADLRDQVWMPATLLLTNGGDMVGFIPTRYPGTLHSHDDALLLGRRTDWADHYGLAQYGLGQRLFATDRADFALMDTRTLAFAHALAASASVDAGAGHG
ncbi:type VI secretion system accessory protein TagJ [Massilia sp. S19_KUP03_FR1]|uniref:type VI secretion system accessory protein TagJ n=1 Tax=Massilia sp. S19_KUP03_FR1 TaxID=3025503 RepID=UPI002FCD8725